MRGWIGGASLGLLLALSAAEARPLDIVAAENFYGDVAAQIGGAPVRVTSILARPDQDPHEFEAGAAAARAIADAGLVIYNGAGYDPWAARLVHASPSPSRLVLVVADLVGRQAGANPHLWYAPATMPKLAEALAGLLTRLDPANRSGYADRLAAFRRSLGPLDARIADLRAKYAGSPVAATEPIFGYMAQALGLDMHGRAFQLAIMNGSEPSAAAIAGFEQDLRSRSVRILFYNSQTDAALTRRMRRIAEQAGVPVVAVGETLPPGEDYQAWMLSQLALVDRALARPIRRRSSSTE